VELARCERLRLAAALAAAALAACSPPPAREVSAEVRPNVLLISLDTVRRDFLSCYGHRPARAAELATTPHLDRLASEGSRFARAYATSSWTLPSHVALMTGLPDLVHAIEIDSLRLAEEHRTLAEDLAEAGYRTAGFFSGPYLDPRFGFDRGFARYEARYGADLTAAASRERRLLDAVRGAREAGGPAAIAEATRRHRAALDDLERASHEDRSAAEVTEAVLDEIAAARADGRPWFVFAHYFDPHHDWTPPAPWDRRFDPDYAGPITGTSPLLDPAISVEAPTDRDPNARRRTASDRDLEHLLALYEGEIAWTDSQIGRILGSLAAEGDLDRTVIVVTADHGEEFFEHGRLGHRQTLFEESLRVPLIVRYPRGVRAGDVPGEVVSLADVRGLILDLVGLPAPAPAAAGRALGRLILVQPFATPAGAPGRRLTIEESYVRWPIKIRRTRSWVEPGSGHEEVLAWIDLAAQPAEPLAAYAQEFADPRSRELLEEIRRGWDAWLERRGAPGTAPAREADVRRLRALGYLGGDQRAVQARIDSFAIPAP
jgi:arylsulfatase A-like enzyme